MKRTPEQKKEYMIGLRNRWTIAKKLFTDKKAKAIDVIMATHGMNFSRMGFFFCQLQMEKQGLEGIPYLDAKTYQGWFDSGFRVRKGEHSTLSGVSWVSVGGKDETDTTEATDGFMFPREYHLFHRTQVEAA